MIIQHFGKIVGNLISRSYAMARFESYSRLRMPHSWNHFNPPSMDTILPGIRPIRSRNQMPKGAIFGGKWIAIDFPKTSGGRRGKSFIARRCPILNSNRGQKCHIFCIVLGLLPWARFYLKFGRFSAVIRYLKWAILETSELPMIPLKFQKNCGQSAIA